MAFGTLFTHPRNSRSVAIKAVAKANGLDLTYEEYDFVKPTEEHFKASPLGKIPAFVGEDGFALSETLAILIYVTSQNEKTTLLGKTKQDYASILRWLSFFNSDVSDAHSGWYYPQNGIGNYNKKSVEDSLKTLEKCLAVVNEHLTHNTYLVGERITLADIFAASLLYQGFRYTFDKQWRQKNSALTRWYETIASQTILTDVIEKPAVLEKPLLTNTPPKKPEQPKPAAQPKAAAPKAAAPAEEEEPAEAPKAKHPLESLPRASYPIDEWKRFYSNNETPDAMEYFWKTVPLGEEYSLWRCAYKYNDELTMTFMSGNLIGGFNNRLEGSRKYFFGSASVYGENNNSIIWGAFVVRGQEFLPVFDVAPDYESYEFTKLDPNNADDKAFVESMWGWDKPITVDGKEYAHAVGKVFK